MNKLSSCGYQPVDDDGNLIIDRTSESGMGKDPIGTGASDPLLPRRDKKALKLLDMLKLRSFCIFFPLRIGAITSAIISCMLVIFMTVSSIMMFIRALAADEKNLPFPEQQYPLPVRKTLEAIQVIGGVQSVLTGFSACLLIVLVIGIIRRKACYISLWLVWDLMFIAAATAASVFGITAGEPINILTLLLLLYKMYCWVVVLSYCQELTEAK